MRKLIGFALLCAISTLLLTACNPNTLALAEAAVSAAEIAVQELAPDLLQKYGPYVNSGMVIVGDFAGQPITAASVGQAITDIKGLAAKLPPGKAPVAIDAISDAFQAFLMALQAQVQTAPGQAVTLKPAAAIKLSQVAPHIGKKAKQIQLRAFAVQGRLHIAK